MNRVKLYVGNIPYTCDAETLRQAFEERGQAPVNVKLITDRETGQPRGFAFVEMGSQADAEAAISAMDGSNFGGRTMRVSLAHQRTDGPGGPGGGQRDGGRPPRRDDYGGGPAGGGYGGASAYGGRDDGDDRRRGGGGGGRGRGRY